MANFATSAKAIMDQYGIDGMDLDYENPSMTTAQSQDFQALVEQLDSTLGKDQFITITVLAGPAYLAGTQTGTGCPCGFASGVLEAIAKLDHVRGINLMTYDLDGARLAVTGRGPRAAWPLL